MNRNECSCNPKATHPKAFSNITKLFSLVLSSINSFLFALPSSMFFSVFKTMPLALLFVGRKLILMCSLGS